MAGDLSGEDDWICTFFNLSFVSLGSTWLRRLSPDHTRLLLQPNRMKAEAGVARTAAIPAVRREENIFQCVNIADILDRFRLGKDFLWMEMMLKRVMGVAKVKTVQ